MGAIRPILMAACGNPDASGDAFGSLVARRLARKARPELEIVDLALNPADLLHCLEDRRALLVVDAAVVPGVMPGRLLDLDYRSSAQSLLLCERATSTHGLGLSAQLAMAESLGWLPPNVRLIVATIPNAGLGLPIPSAMSSVVSDAVRTILEWVARWRSDFDAAPVAPDGLRSRPKGE
ncbi:MAG: hydrogenase maturation protease [Tepidisphaeraceae bacterium]|jgi:hydrogenase maturation protease